MTDAEPEPGDRRFEAVKALNAALAKAQGEFPPIPASKTVDSRAYKFSYAPLDKVLAAVRPALAKHGLAVTQRLEDSGRLSLRTELRHAEGGVLGASFPLLNVPESPQQLGSLLTYLRRYALVSLLGVASEEDDDGNAAADAPAVEPKLAKSPESVARGMLWAKIREVGLGDDQVRQIVSTVTGDERGSTKKLTVVQYNAIMAEVDKIDRSVSRPVSASPDDDVPF